MKSFALLILAILLAVDYTGAMHMKDDVTGPPLNKDDEQVAVGMASTDNGNDTYGPGEDPEEGKLPKGDELPSPTALPSLPPQDNANERAAVPDPDGILRWPGGRVPYVISASFSKHDRGMIEKAVLEFKKYTCIKFVPKSAKDKTYIHMYMGDGCFSSVGRVGSKGQGGEQKLSLGTDCLHKVGTPIHEMMHALGFDHEQSRDDRETYVKIQWWNIKTGKADQFQQESHIDTKLGYDIGSVMHYEPYAFSKNKKKTIVAQPKYDGHKMGNRAGFSQADIKRINSLYCNGPVYPDPPSDGAACKDTTFDGRDCRGFSHYCTHIYFGAAMKRKCPITCGVCTPAADCSKGDGSYQGNKCSDLSAWGYCRGKRIDIQMKMNCPHTCGYCKTDTGTTDTGTTVVDECKEGTHNCAKNGGICTDKHKGFSCACKSGYAGDGKTCTRQLVDECSMGTHNCDVNGGVCIDLYEGFTCVCKSGYAGDGKTCTLQLVDECKEGTHNCAKNGGMCKDKPEGFTCACKSGYAGDGKTCTPQSGDACKDTTFQDDNCRGFYRSCHLQKVKEACPHTCGVCTPDPPSGADCKDTSAHGTKCEYWVKSDCNKPYFKAELWDKCPIQCGYCTPVVDECKEGTHNCAKNGGVCTDKHKGFSCACKSGYAGDGKTCTPQSGDACKDTTFQSDKCGGFYGSCHVQSVKEACPHTCGVCTPDPPSGADCKDTSADGTKCEDWVKSDCKKPYFKAELWDKCPIHCGYCKADTGTTNTGTTACKDPTRYPDCKNYDQNGWCKGWGDECPCACKGKY